MSQPPTREQLIAALIVLGDQTPEETIAHAKWLAMVNPDDCHPLETEVRRELYILEAYFPALYAHVSQPSGLSAGKGER